MSPTGWEKRSAEEANKPKPKVKTAYVEKESKGVKQTQRWCYLCNEAHPYHERGTPHE